MKTERSAAGNTKNILPRIYSIDRKIASGTYPNSEDLAGEYEVSVSTITRDIEFMRDMLHAPIEYDALHRGYYYTKKTYRVPGSFAGAEDLKAISIVKNLLVMYRNTPIYDVAKRLLDTITAPLSGSDNPRWFENRIVVPPIASAAVDTEIWSSLTKALQYNRVVVFEYKGLRAEEYSLRRVHPYQLLFDAGLWLLYGHSEERDGIRIFSLSRMRNVSITENGFRLPEDYSYLASADGSYFGVFSGGKKQRFRMVFYGDSTLWVRERVWAADQELRQTRDGGVMISFTSTQYHKVFEWVLSKGGMAKPLEPKVLVRDWKCHIEAMKKTAEDSMR